MHDQSFQLTNLGFEPSYTLAPVRMTCKAPILLVNPGWKSLSLGNAKHIRQDSFSGVYKAATLLLQPLVDTTCLTYASDRSTQITDGRLSTRKY